MSAYSYPAADDQLSLYWQLEAFPSPRICEVR
jgi:hypothetical protein